MNTRKGKGKGKGTKEPLIEAGDGSPEASGTPTEAPPAGEVVLYESSDGGVQVDVRLEQETVWLTQRQIAELLDTGLKNVNQHLLNVFQDNELEEAATNKDFWIVQTEGGREVRRSVAHYNLDAIIAVGYRVNSRRGTQFRIWATRTLREHLLRGFTLNENRLRERGMDELQQAVSLLANAIRYQGLDSPEARAIAEVIDRYSLTWRLLVQYDERNLADRPAVPCSPRSTLKPDAARALISNLRALLLARGDASPLFGTERTAHLEAILGTLEQTFDGRPLYPSVQSRAAHLLYFVIKDHPFTDGNKRIGALLFLEYLRGHDLLELSDGTPRLANNAMVALALLIAESEPRNKDLMIRVVLNLLEDDDAAVRRADGVKEDSVPYAVARAA